METIASVFTTHRFDVEIVTPVHVGMAQEKNYVRGLDYVLENNEVRIIHTEQLLKLLSSVAYKKDLQELTLALSSGQASKSEAMLKQLLKNYPDIKFQQLSIQGKPDEIKRLYRTGLGQYALPGSSIKGAIRSILLAKLKDQQLHSNRRQDELDTLMGRIDSNLMRYVQVGDVTLPTEAIAIRRTKIFSADSTAKGEGERGEWKHLRQSGHSPKFDDSKYPADAFVTFYEAAVPDFVPNESPVLTIRLGVNLPKVLEAEVIRNVPSYETLLKGRDGAWLVQTIRAHTKQYLEREKAYFQKFGNTDLDKQTPIQKRMNALLAVNNEPDSCLLRIGAGVGFHSITGDWQLRSQDHFNEWNTIKNAIFAKTRKFAFTEQNRDVDFALMGFLKLTLQTPESAAAREQKLLKAQQQAKTALAQAEAQATQREAERLATEAESKRQAEEAKKPKLFTGVLKQNQELDAEIVVSAQKNKVKVYAAGYETKIFDLEGYKGAEPIGKVVIVKADQFDKKKVLTQVRYNRFK